MRLTLAISLSLLWLLAAVIEGEETTVISDSAAYDGSSVVLQGNVIVEHVMGRLTAEMALLSRDDEKKTKIDFPWIEAQTNVVVNLADGSLLQCERVKIDYIEKTSLFYGNPQLYFCDQEKRIYADRATVDFKETEKGEIRPIKITLTGNVQLIQVQKNQQAIAESVEYYPQDARIIFQGSPALFYDPAKEMKLSARLIQAERDPETGCDRIQGFGKVRFSFRQDEYLKLKERLRWKENIP